MTLSVLSVSFINISPDAKGVYHTILQVRKVKFRLQCPRSTSRKSLDSNHKRSHELGGQPMDLRKY